MAIGIYQFTNPRQRTADSGLVQLSRARIRDSRFANVEWEYGSEASGHLRGAEDRGLRVSRAVCATSQRIGNEHI